MATASVARSQDGSLRAFTVRAHHGDPVGDERRPSAAVSAKSGVSPLSGAPPLRPRMLPVLQQSARGGGGQR